MSIGSIWDKWHVYLLHDGTRCRTFGWEFAARHLETALFREEVCSAGSAVLMATKHQSAMALVENHHGNNKITSQSAQCSSARLAVRYSSEVLTKSWQVYPKQDTCDLARCESCTSQDQMLDSSPLRFWDQLLLYQIFSPKSISHGLAFRSKQRRHAALLAARVKALQRASADWIKTPYSGTSWQPSLLVQSCAKQNQLHEPT